MNTGSAPAQTAADAPPRADRTTLAFALTFAAVWLACAWQPAYRQDWALENLLALAAVWGLLRLHRCSPLSHAAYAMLLAFGIVHELGAHYTYSEVPYERWTQAMFGISLNELLGLSRNHYDRLVHFLFGLLWYRPLRELLAPRLPLRSAVSRFAPITVVATVSLVYELIEWAVAMIFGGDLGQAYLGMQGDVWDSQKDSGLALAGALIACALDLIHRRLNTLRRDGFR